MNYLNNLKLAVTAGEEKKAASAHDELEIILSGIGKINVEKPELPAAPEYERMSYSPPSDADIAEAAKAALTEYKQLSEKAIQSEADGRQEAKETEIKNERMSGEEQSAKIRNEYEGAVQDFENDAIKRGIARSSIALNNSAALRSEGADAIIAAAAKTEENVKSLEAEIAKLEAGRQTALDNFNIAYAAKLTERISELSAERDEKKSEVIKYNNALTEKETAAMYEKMKTESDLYGEALINAEKKHELDSHTSIVVYEAKYNAIDEYLKGLNKADAKTAVLTDKLIRDSLNDSYYYKLYNAYVVA